MRDVRKKLKKVQVIGRKTSTLKNSSEVTKEYLRSENERQELSAFVKLKGHLFSRKGKKFLKIV